MMGFWDGSSISWTNANNLHLALAKKTYYYRYNCNMQ